MTAEVAVTTDGSIERIQSYGRLRGLGGLTAAESKRWLPWRALTFTILGLVLLAGAYAVWFGGEDLIVAHLVMFFFSLWTFLLILMTVASTQGMVASEIAQGTAAWVTAKPVGRPAFVVSKFLALVPVVVVAMVGIPGIAARYVLDVAQDQGRTDFNAEDLLRLVEDSSSRNEYHTVPGMGRYLGVLALIATVLLVVAAVMVLLGCVLRHATAILAIGLMVPLAMLILSTSVDHQIVSLTPAWAMEAFVDSVRDDPAPVLGPILVSGLWILGLLGVASWWFNRREL